MATPIRTDSVGKNVAKTSPVLLDGSPETRLVFQPLVHLRGVRGLLIRYKKKKTDKWEELRSSSFVQHNLAPGEKVEIDLPTKAVEKFIEEIQSRQEIVRDGVKYGHHEYLTVEKNKVVVIDDHNKKSLLDQLLAKGYSDDFWQLISSSDPNLADQFAAGQLQIQRRKVIYELKKRLTETYSETIGPESWQKWIYSNNWLFGAVYQKPIQKQKLNISGVMPDYLFPTLDGFIDILEIKLPSCEVINEDANHSGSWVWSSDTNAAIGQVVNYLSEIDRLRYEIEKEVETKYGKVISMLKPRAYILIGNNITWSKLKKEGLRKLNHSLHGIEIITYSDLEKRGESYIEEIAPEVND